MTSVTYHEMQNKACINLHCCLLNASRYAHSGGVRRERFHYKDKSFEDHK